MAFNNFGNGFDLQNRSSLVGFGRMVESLVNPFNNKMTMDTMKFRFLGQVMKDLGMSWDQINNLVREYSPVHPQVASEMLIHSGIIDEETETMFAQDFIRNDRLMRQLKRMPRKKAEAVLAMDGLAGTISPGGPAMEAKRYFENLRFGLDGSSNIIPAVDDESIWKKRHVDGVRKLYEKIGNAMPNEEQLSGYVYQILKNVIENVGFPQSLPSGEECQLPTEKLKECMEFYLSVVGQQTVLNLMENLKVKRDKNDEVDGMKKRRIERMVEEKF